MKHVTLSELCPAVACAVCGPGRRFRRSLEEVVGESIVEPVFLVRRTGDRELALNSRKQSREVCRHVCLSLETTKRNDSTALLALFICYSRRSTNAFESVALRRSGGTSPAGSLYAKNQTISCTENWKGCRLSASPAVLLSLAFLA
jgi:hypothetical protein